MEFRPRDSLLALSSDGPAAATVASLGLDSPGDACFVSHAHSDHVSFVRASHKVIASSQTHELARARGKKNTGVPLEANEFGGARIRLAEAGHILGARQVCVEADGRKFVYTGDFNATPSATCPPAQAIECDELLVECTYGSPEWVFPAREEVYAQVAEFVRENQTKGIISLLGGYSLGKAQELVAILNEYAGEAPVVSGTTLSVCDVYKRNGVKLDYIPSGGPQASEEYGGAFSAVVPLNNLSFELARSISSHYRRPVRTAIATGWALHNSFAGVDAAFALSDHSDFNSLLEFVQATAASKVWCTHGFEEEFAAELRRRGIDARPVGGEGETQTKLLSYSETK